MRLYFAKAVRAKIARLKKRRQWTIARVRWKKIQGYKLCSRFQTRVIGIRTIEIGVRCRRTSDCWLDDTQTRLRKRLL